MERARLERLAERYARRNDVSALSIGVHAPEIEWRHDGDRPYFIASTTKLFTTAIVMQLRNEGLIRLDDPIGDHLGPDVTRGLNVHGGVDRSADVTVRQLLSHTSGIPDYFERKRPDGSTLLSDILRADRGWSFEETLEIARSLEPTNPPGEAKKATYADTNYQLLGAVIEARTGRMFEPALRERILAPLGLSSTWLFTRATLERYDEVAPVLNGTRPVRIPQAMASFGPDGGIVSTATEQVTFLRAFVAGELFPRSFLDEMTSEWRRWRFPLEYGVGIMRFALPRVMTLGRAFPPMIGHSGASGAVLFHSPVRELFVAATVNQIAKRSLSYQLLSRV
jgi:D-alanyl-D-alanine carboxypeptidase